MFKETTTKKMFMSISSKYVFKVSYKCPKLEGGLSIPNLKIRICGQLIIANKDMYPLETKEQMF